MKILQSFTIFSLSFLALMHTSTAATSLGKIAAIVNNDVVMLNSVQEQAKRLKTQKSFAKLSNKALQKEALEHLIMDSLQSQRATQIGLAVDDAALNTTMQSLAQQNQLTLEQFQKALKHEGINYRVFREQIRKRLLINELRKRQLKRNTNITNQAVDDLIANQSSTILKGIEFRIKHLLIPAPAGTALPALLKVKNEAEVIRADLLSGKSTQFNTRVNARVNTQAKTTNWTAAKNLPPSLIRHISLLEIGQISDVFQDSKGFHIVKLVDKRGAKKVVVNEYHARHILLKTTSANDDNQTKNTLAEIRNKILAGAKFETLAKQHSQDVGSAVSGGDLGWGSAENYVPAFAKTIKNTPVNKISLPFKSKFGWHIVQVLETKTVDRTEDLLRNQAKGLLNKNKAEKEYDSWLKQLRNDAFVEYRIKL